MLLSDFVQYYTIVYHIVSSPIKHFQNGLAWEQLPEEDAILGTIPNTKRGSLESWKLSRIGGDDAAYVTEAGLLCGGKASSNRYLIHL
jgi:hypothetical protein